MVRTGSILIAGTLLSASMMANAFQTMVGGYAPINQGVMATAITAGDHKKLSKLLENGFEANGEKGLELLKLAVEKNDNKAAQLILEAGLDLSANQDDSLLSSALANNNVNIFDTLLEAGAVVNSSNYKSLMEQAKSADNPKFKSLIEAGYAMHNK